MRLSDKSVLFISNPQSTTEKDNTLTNFSGSIPSNFLNQHKSWKVAVHSCGIHMMLKQPLTPKYENLPSIIQITYENLDILAKTHRLAGLRQFKLDMFKNSLQFYMLTEKNLIHQKYWRMIFRSKQRQIYFTNKDLLKESL